MPQGPKRWTTEIVAKYVAQGRGKGHGAEYQPWINVAEVSSKGRSRRAYSAKTERVHQLLSDVEWNLFLLLEFDDSILDIREQFPLDPELTVQIAAELQITHPCYPGTNIPAVMTTDFLVTKARDAGKYFVAFDAKVEAAAEDERAIEKLQIQKAYLEGMGISHHIVFNTSIPLQVAKNISWIREGPLARSELERVSGQLEQAIAKMSNDFVNSPKRSMRIKEYCADFDSRYAYELGTGLRAVKSMLWTKTLITDLSNPKIIDAPLSAFRVVKELQMPENKLRVIGAHRAY